MLAAGIGNIHGKYPANWQGLAFDALEAINNACGNMPLVLHGGTGIPEEMIKKAISLGVSKINVNTECQLAFQEATRAYVEAGKDKEGKGFDPRKLLNPGFEAIKATVKNVNTECQLAFQEATRAYVEAGKDKEGKGFDPRKLLNPGFEAIKATVKEKMELFGSVNKA